MAKSKKKLKQVTVQTKEQRRAEKVARLAHKILTQTIWPANLELEEAVDVAITVVKGLVLSNTSDDDPEDRSDMIAAIEDHFLEVMTDIDPLVDRAHLWLVAPQGLITEPFGILWDGAYEEHSVKCVLGAELELLRAKYSETQAETHAIIVEGVEGVAAITPDWDGEDTITCANPECGQVHNAHLAVAEELFQQTVERRQKRLDAN